MRAESLLIVFAQSAAAVLTALRAIGVDSIDDCPTLVGFFVPWIDLPMTEHARIWIILRYESFDRSDLSWGHVFIVLSDDLDSECVSVAQTLS